MNLIIKQIIIVIITFLIILWFQNNDDYKYNKHRISLYDKYKLPLLVSAIVCLVMNLSMICNVNKYNILNNDNEKINIINKIHSPICDHNKLQILTDLPDF